jgi:hypothetical protein
VELVVTIRRILAFPFYLVAFALHLLCALFTVLAQKISGDAAEAPKRSKNIFAIAFFCCTAASAWPIYVLNHSLPRTKPSDFIANGSMQSWRTVPKNFTPDQIVWVEPLIKLNACIFAENAVKNALDPVSVEFAPCGGKGNNVTLDDDYFEANVSGVAKVNGTERTFDVDLNHYPPATSERAFIATAIHIKNVQPKAACASVE